MAPYFLRYGLFKEAFLGTEALAAAGTHISKLIIWGQASLIGTRDLILLAPLAMLMVVGMLALIVTLVSALGSDATRAGMHIESGLWIVVLGFVVTFVGLSIESSRPAVRQIPAPPSPGWPS